MENKIGRGLVKGLLVFASVLILAGAFGVEAQAAKLNNKTLVLDTGVRHKLRVKGTKKAIKWSSSDKRIASVSKKGNVRARRAGEVIITAKYGKKKLTCKVTVRKPMQYYAHRGFRSQYPENTIPSFTGAMKAGFNGIEIDVFEAKNGEILVFHDETTDRMCKRNGSIYDITVNNRDKYWITAGANISKYSSKSKRLYIPTLEETIKSVKKRNARVYIHLKGLPQITDVGVAKIEQVLRKHKMVDRSIVFAGNGNVVKRFERRGLNVGLNVTSLTTTTADEKLTESIAIGAKSMIIFHPADATKKIVRRARKAGIEIGVYNVKTKAQAKRLRNMGVDFVFSDFALFK